MAAITICSDFGAPKNSLALFPLFPHLFAMKAMAPHSSTLAWKIPWTEEPGRLQSMGSRRVRHDRATSLSLFAFMHWRRKWQPTPVFLPGESQGEPGGLPSMGSHSSSRLFTIKIPCTSAPALTFLMQSLCSLLWALMEAIVGLQPPPVVISNVSFCFLGDLSLSKYNESLRSVFKIGIFIWVFLILFISTLLYVWKLSKFRVEKNTFFPPHKVNNLSYWHCH